MNKQHIIINGRSYDSATGLPVDGKPIPPQVDRKKSGSATAPRGVALSKLHRHTEKSTILNRRHVAKPQNVASQPAAPIAHRRNLTIQTSRAVTRFANGPYLQPDAEKQKAQQTTRPDRPAETHPAVLRAQHRRGHQPGISSRHGKVGHTPSRRQVYQQQRAAQPKPAAVLKNEAIADALNRSVAPDKTSHKTPVSPVKRWLRLSAVGLAVAILGGYLTYLTMPNLSVRLAAIQSGVNARYPGYRPSGYALSGPISFKQGEVQMKFAYAGGGQSYSLTQEKSSLDTAALKETITRDGDDPQVTTANGLTIYRIHSSAAWINSGILYRISGADVLSSEQITKIATSI